MASDYKLAIKIAGQLDGSLVSAVNGAQQMLDQLNGGGKQTIGQKIASGVKSGVTTGLRSMFFGSAASLAAMGIAAGKVVKESVETGMDFESAMTDVAGVFGINTASEAFAQLGDAAQYVGATTNKSATEAAAALKYMGLAGWDTERSIAALEDMVKLSSVSGEDLGRTSDLVTDSMGALGLTAADYASYMDMVAQADAAANYSATQFMETMIGAGGSARLLGVDIKDLAAAAGVLANNGTKGSEAGTALNGMFTRLAKQSEPVAKALNEIGVTLDDGTGHFKAFPQIMSDIKAGLAGVENETERASIAANLFGTNYQSEAQYLLDSIQIAEDGSVSFGEFADKLSSAYDGIDEHGESIDALGQRYDTATDNLQGDLDIMKSAASAFGIDIYNSIVGGSEGGGLRGAVQEVTNIIGELKTAFDTDGLSGLADAIGEEIANISSNIADKGPQAITDATQFATDIIDSIGSPEHSEEIGGAAAAIITSLGINFLEYTDNFGVAASNLIKGLIDGMNEEDAPYKWADAVGDLAANLGEAFTANPKEFGAAAGNLLSSLVTGLAANSGKILAGGIQIVQGLAEGIIQAGFILISHGPEIIDDLLHGILEEGIPQLFATGKALASALIDGIASLGSSIGKAFIDAMTMDSEHIEMGDVFSAPMLDAYTENIDVLNDKMIELVNTTGNYELTGLQTELLEGSSTIQEVLAQMGEINPDSVEYAEIAADLQGFAGLMQAAMNELGISYEQAEEMMEGASEISGESADGISAETQALVDSITEGKDGFASGSEAMIQELENLASSAEQTGSSIQESLNTDLSSSMNADALSVLLQSIDAGSIDTVVAQLNTSMEEIRTAVDTASSGAQTAMETAMTGITSAVSTAQISVGFNMSLMTLAVSMQGALAVASANMTASGIVNAFSGIDLYSVGYSIIDGLRAGIAAAGAAAIAEAQSIAQQISSTIAGALQVHSPSKVMIGIGEYVGEGLQIGLQSQEGSVYSASQALASRVAMGTNDSVSAPLRQFNESSMGGGMAGSGSEPVSININFSPNITITGNASESDVRHAVGMSITELEKMFDRIMANKRRTAFA